MLNRSGSLKYARSRAQDFIATAKEALSGLKQSDAKDALIETADFMVGRMSWNKHPFPAVGIMRLGAPEINKWKKAGILRPAF